MRTRKMTIAQLREIALERFNSEYIKNEDKARNIVNRFYRLAGADDRLLILNNDERTADRPYTKELEERTEKALNNLRNDLKEYGLTIRYYSWLPTLEEIDTQHTALTVWYYER